MNTQNTNQDQHDTTTEEPFEMPPVPEVSSAVRALDRLVGTWEVADGATGTVTYEWMEGCYFLLQRVELEQFGQEHIGMEVIGNLRSFGQEPTSDVYSRFHDNEGHTLDYVYELKGDTLTIWGEERGSEAKFVGTFNEDDTVMAGEWVYPGGGGYDSTMTRID